MLKNSVEFGDEEQESEHKDQTDEVEEQSDKDEGYFEENGELITEELAGIGVLHSHPEDQIILLDSLRYGYLFVINVGYFQREFASEALSKNCWAFPHLNDRNRISPGDFVLFVMCLSKSSDNQVQGFNRKETECYGRAREIVLVKVKSTSDDCTVFPHRESRKQSKIEVLRFSFEFDVIMIQESSPFIDFTFENWGKAVLEARRKSDIGRGAAHYARTDEEYLERVYLGKVPFFDETKPLKPSLEKMDPPSFASKKRRKSAINTKKRGPRLDPSEDEEMAFLTRMVKVHYHNPLQEKECVRVSTTDIRSMFQFVEMIKTSFKLDPSQEIKIHYVDPDGDNVLLEDRSNLQEEVSRFAKSIHIIPISSS